MNNKFVFPNFDFYPKQLVEESKKIRKKYKNAEDGVTPDRVIIDLPKLLKEIRALANNNHVILEYARKLKRIDVNILASEYPYEVENQNTIRKITLILRERYSRIVGRRFWIHFQQLPFDQQIITILSHAFRTDKENYLSLNRDIREKYNHIFSKPEVLDRMAYEIGNVRKPVELTMRRWKVSRKGQLAYELWKRILKTYLPEQWFVRIEDEAMIEKRLENMPLDDYVIIIRTYLERVDLSDYSPILLNQAIQRLLDPRFDSRRWKGISYTTVEKVKQWLYRNELLEFLDYERFNYWEKYIRRLNDLKVIQEPPIAAMYFNEFVVIEFALVNNAAYFYERVGFEEFLAPKLKSNVPESFLKNRNASYYINKLNHTKNTWHSRFDEYMTHYLQGHFWYKH